MQDCNKVRGILTSIGLGSKESTTPAISVILCSKNHQQYLTHIPCNIGFIVSPAKKNRESQEATGVPIHLKIDIFFINSCIVMQTSEFILVTFSKSSNVPQGCTELPIAGLLLKYQEQVLLGTPTIAQTTTLRILSRQRIEFATSDAIIQSSLNPRHPSNIRA
jgi:hypothetical protein